MLAFIFQWALLAPLDKKQAQGTHSDYINT